MVWQFIEVFKKIATGQKIQDDDFADRLSHRYTVIFLLVFCILVGSSQFVGSPIACWAPAHFTGAMVTYTNYICWIANTYFVPTDNILPTPTGPRQMINYYQWIPFILFLMAFLFYAPFAVWHVLSKQNTVQAKSVMKIIQAMDQASTESREKSLRAVARIIDRSIDYNRDFSDIGCLGRLRRLMNRCFLPLSKQDGSYISALYIITKLLYLVNVCGQFFLLNAFMGPDFNIYGFQVIRDLWQGRDFWESPRFPRVTMCDFTIRTLGENNQRNTIQCTLPINLFNEKIFIFIWFWLFVVATLSFYSFFVWIGNFSGGSRLSFVRRYMRTQNHLASAKAFDDFVFKYLRQDGVFLLRIVKKNSNDLVVGELICALWDQYKRSNVYHNNNDDSLTTKDSEKLNSGENLIPNGYHHNP
jgi:hypothetical protein